MQAPMAHELSFRPPSSSPGQSTPFPAPSVEYLKGSWYVTHSTLPMWSSNRNVVIKYTPLEKPVGGLESNVEYQPLKSDKHKSVDGIETPDPNVPGAYDWRGKGWLKIVSSHWEILGYGEEEDGWAVTFFQKTLFTPAGVDIYVRRKGGISQDLVHRLRAEMKKINDPVFQKLAEQLFEIKHEW